MPAADDPLTAIPGVGPRRAADLADAGITRLSDLLWHLPRSYEDRRLVTAIADVVEGESVQVRGIVGGLSRKRLRGRRSLVEGTVTDATGRLAAVWFNQGWIAEKLADRECVLFGPAAREASGRLVLRHPTIDTVAGAASDPGGSGRVVPIYPATGGFQSRQVERWATWVLDNLELDACLPDRVPPEILRRRRLPRLREAVERLHRPRPDVALADLLCFGSPWHRRLVYGELFRQQLTLARRATARRRQSKSHCYRIDDATRRVARDLLPFTLTTSQRRVLGEIVGDLAAKRPMRRLLQGDVGSGKTIVAALAMLVAVESGLQTALLAPTEVLAEQHAVTLSELFGSRNRVALLTGSQSDDERRAALASGETLIVVGTHALLESAVVFDRLALVVIDEQHRFGVGQREAMLAKGRPVDALVMSATPIPRSLALSAYGDLDVSVLDEKPAGRQPVSTELVEASRRPEIWARIRTAVQQGGQVYVVFPAIDRSDETDMAALADVGEAMRADLEDLGCTVVHGRLSSSERAERLASFREGRVRVLLATTVIEVGVDVPEATGMVIESAERFGLAQLHQLRGRVGRGADPSWCVAIHAPLSEIARPRLEAFRDSTDGFELAERDLELRGPGELLGVRQAGVTELRFADLIRDREVLLEARADAVGWAETEATS